jgi:hypothetical protein
MNPLALDLLAFALSFAAFSAIALGTERHARQVLGRQAGLPVRRALGTAGWVLLLASLFPALAARGPSIGSLNWLGYLSVASAAIALLLSYRPQPLRFLAPALLVLALAVWGIAGH